MTYYCIYAQLISDKAAAEPLSVHGAAAWHMTNKVFSVLQINEVRGAHPILVSRETDQSGSNPKTDKKKENKKKKAVFS